MFPKSWTGTVVAGGGSVVIRYGSSNWKHATNANDPGTFFLGIQQVSNYVEQTITVPSNTNFAVQFDVSARQLFAVATLEVYCNAAGNTGTTTISSTTTTTSTNTNTNTNTDTNTNTNTTIMYHHI